MQQDAAIVVNLHRIGDGMNATYKVDSPHYKNILDHRGGMKPGETKLVSAFGQKKK
jgi:hypothetical protein